MKVRTNQILDYIDELEFEPDGRPNDGHVQMRKYKESISKETGVPTSNIKLVWSGEECEYCIYLNNKWCGYLQTEITETTDK